MRSTIRHGDTMIAVETTPATIDYADILDATEVDADDSGFSDAPWENSDGFEHTATPERRMPDEADAREMRGNVWTNREQVVIQLAEGEDWGIYKHARENGASRQVAAELVAASRRQTLDQLCRWYLDGWQWYGVRCEFAVLGDEYGASVWGIDDPDYAEDSVREEIAGEVVHQLEEAGYTVTGKPEPPKRLHARHCGTVVSREGIRQEWYTRGLTREEWQAEHARKLATQNWKADR